MSKRMLIDTTHAEETRVVVLDGNRLEDYDVETSAKKQLKGNIYLAKVVRVEPSLQAAFVEYGGNRHGFLAFSEIHPDYYQIPVADRERLIALQEEEARAEDAREEAREAAAEQVRADDAREDAREDASDEAVVQAADADATDEGGDEPHDAGHPVAALASPDDGQSRMEPAYSEAPAYPETAEYQHAEDTGYDSQPEPAPETVGGENDSSDDSRTSQQSSRFLRQYKIQEVIRRRQILLIQVVKEERGNKGAALTTYISLAGRFCVLMPNSLRGGGVSRKITSAADRKRLKEITTELEIPRGMAMIVRTAGAQRPRPEIRRDCEYLLRLWDDIREQTLRAMAPALINEEANLIKRAIRDVYTRDIEEITVDGETGWKAAREFMRNLMPAHAQKVMMWRDQGQPLFSFYQVEHHLDAMLQPTVQLRSGGYLVINQTEALVAIDVNSGRSTRERGIEETALRTNLEAADEVARQLRLRDLAGLIVIDFIDMEARRHNAMVERRLKDALKNDRARIQLGTISHFGLMEMSRQRLRPSIAESSFVACVHCAGTGFVRGTDSAALHVLRAIEEEGGKQRAAEILVHAASAVTLYVLNHKRVWLAEIEQRHRMTVNFATDDSLIPPEVRIAAVRPQVAAPVLAAPIVAQSALPTMPMAEVAAERHLPANGVITHGIATDPFETEEAEEEFQDAPDVVEAPGPDMLQDNLPAAAAETGEDEHKRKRRRRRRRGGRRDDASGSATPTLLPQDAEQPDVEHAGIFAQSPEEARANVAPEGARANVAPEGALANVVPLHAAPPNPTRQARESVDDDADGELPLETGGQSRGEVPLSEEQGMAPRKRGRRGGARGRKPREQDRDQDEPARPADEVQLQSDRVPAYDGPTPADPFGGGYDIFDLIEQDGDLPPEKAIEAAAPEPAAETAELPLEAASEPAAAEPEPEPVAEPEATAAKPKRKRAASPRAKAVVEAAAKPAAVAKKAPRMTKARKAELAAAEALPEPAPDEPTSPEPGPPEPGPSEPTPNETIQERPGNVVQPMLIDNLEAPAARRTGWWKR